MQYFASLPIRIFRINPYGFRAFRTGYGIKDTKFRVKDIRFGIKDTKFRVKDIRFGIKGTPF